MTDEHRESKCLGVSIALGILAATMVGGPNEQFLAHVPFYAKPLLKGLVAGAFSSIG
jgi:hypothetical protein